MTTGIFDSSTSYDMRALPFFPCTEFFLVTTRTISFFVSIVVLATETICVATVQIRSCVNRRHSVSIAALYMINKVDIDLLIQRSHI